MKRFVYPAFTPALAVTLGALLSAQTTIAAVPTVSVLAAPTNEGLSEMQVTFSLSSAADGGESLSFDLIEGTATTADFSSASGTVIEFAAGETTKSTFVTLADDAFPEVDETFQMVLSNPTGLTFAASSYSLTILDDDGAALLPSFFSDGMVLQREKGAKFWGYACPNCPVVVTFAGRTWNAVSASDGRFEVVLDNLLASSVERDLTITSNGEIETITGVLVGEVWMGAGQSNMEFPFSFLPSPENDAEVASANDPLLRLYLPTEQARENPVDTIEGDWLSAVPGDMPDMPALPYFIAKRLRAELGVPVAIIECAWGGQRIEGFISETKLLTFPEGSNAVADKNADYAAYAAYEAELAAWLANPQGPEPQPPGDDPRFEPSLAGQIYNGMVAPLAGYGVRGILFYQGEANSFFFSPSNYADFMEALVADWRAAWGEELPFYYMQLANFVSSQRPLWVNVQNEQRVALENLTSVGMTVGNDIGNPNDIHPTNKSNFADRFVRWPLLNEYGQTSVVPSGPLYRNATVAGGAVTVEFDYSMGLSTRDALPLGGFQLREGSGPWVNASATISGETVVVTAASKPNPTEVRYAWNPDPTMANLVNSAGLPASVFVATPGPPAPLTVTATASPINEGFIGYPVQLSLSAPAQGGEQFSFSLVAGSAGPNQDFVPWVDGLVVFNQGETSQTLWLTLVDDAVIEPDETFIIQFFAPSGLLLAQSELELTIVNDDTLLDDFGDSYGLSVAERAGDADGDGDGIPVLIEFAFNLNPTVAESPCYVSGVTLDTEGEPFGLPQIVSKTDPVTGDLEVCYVFVRRTDAAPRVEYFPEVAQDDLQFQAATPNRVTSIGDHWEEVEIVIGGDSFPLVDRRFARVRVVSNE
ncbi:MAG: Calx-beta domain-containing protein [Roseibacillus sp.]